MLEQRLDSLDQLLDNCCSDYSGVGPNPALPRPCNSDESITGGPGLYETTHNLGEFPGNVFVDFDMKTIPDKMDIYYDGNLVASTNNLVSGNGSIRWFYAAEKGKPTSCKVVLSAPYSQTEWKYFISCPQ